MPKVFLASAGHWINVVLTLVPMISNTDDWISGSVIRLMCPLRTFLSQIANGFEPIEYKMDKKPDWKVLRNMLPQPPGAFCTPAPSMPMTNDARRVMPLLGMAIGDIER